MEKQFRDGFQNGDVTVLPNLGQGYKTIGIEAARSIFPQCFFDENKCAEGLEAMRNYRYERDDHGQWSRTPLHDENSHAADALRYLASAIQQPRKEEKLKYKRLGTA